jgi:arylsulfatase A
MNARRPHLVGRLLVSAQVAAVCSLLDVLSLGPASAHRPPFDTDSRRVVPQTREARPPNLVVILADDLGYGDLPAYGHPTMRTPRLDRMAAEGQRWTSFYVAAPVCTPSRAALLTGRLPVRSGMASAERRVLYPDSSGGLPASEVTIAEVLKARAYATAAIGKWHLGHLPEHLPRRHGFDTYFGIPYSNDMDADPKLTAEAKMQRVRRPRREDFKVPLLRDATELERPVDQTTITRRYTEEAVRFIADNRDGPFFLYLAHTMPHVPLYTSPEFTGKSARGHYGDVIAEIDWSVGRVLDALREHGVDERTLVVFTSDNGPWLLYTDQGGSTGLLRGGKGDTFDGGMRVPAVFRWPGRVRPSVVQEMGSTLDLLPTFARLAGAQPPTDRVLDGVDLGPVLLQTGTSPRDAMYFYRDDQLSAVRSGPFKAHFFTQPGYGPGSDRRTAHDPPLLYHLEQDPSEQFDVAEQHPGVVAEIRRLADAHRKTLTPVENQLTKVIATRR